MIPGMLSQVPRRQSKSNKRDTRRSAERCVRGGLKLELLEDRCLLSVGHSLLQRLHAASNGFGRRRPDTDVGEIVETRRLDLTEGTAFTGEVARFNPPGVIPISTTFTATIDWGDGTTPTDGNVNGRRGTLTVFGSHTYAEEGRYLVTVTLHGSNGSTLVNASYNQTNLVSDDSSIPAATNDPNLVNPWGIAAGPNTPFWIADNEAGVSTIYDSTGTPRPLVVTIPAPPGSTDPAAPTGLVFNGTADFAVTGGPARFIFATEDGTISGWNNGTTAELKVDNSSVDQSLYKGLAIGNVGTANFIYATDFRNNQIDVFDGNWQPATLTGNFADPNIPAGFGPFGIQAIGDRLFVTYAMQDADHEDDVPGPGAGFVDEFAMNGNLIRSFASGGTLNAPWGVARAPNDFGLFSGDILIGNFGDGRINAFDPNTGAFQGQLADVTGTPLAIEGLWGLSFGNNSAAGAANVLFFTAGPDDEEHGLFGRITAAGPTVAVVADAPLRARGVPFRATPGVQFTGVVANFVDLNPSGAISDFTVTIDWGDGTPLSPGIVAANSSGGFQVTGSHTFAQAGNFRVHVLIEDTGGSTARTSSPAIVSTGGHSVRAIANHSDMFARFSDVM